METRKEVPLPISKQLKEKMDRQKEIKQISSKIYGDFLVSATNICFDRCMDTTRLALSRAEGKCVRTCIDKLYAANECAMQKFRDTNEKLTQVNLLRANDYITPDDVIPVKSAEMQPE